LAVAFFYSGIKYDQTSLQASVKNARGSFTGNFQGANGTAAGRNMTGRTQGGGLATGQIISKDSTSLTLKSRDGNTKIVLYSPDVSILKTGSGTPQDLISGTEVNVIGAANSDGSITAQSIQVRLTPLPISQ